MGYVSSMAVAFGDEDLEVEAAELRENLNQMSDNSYDAVARKKMVTQSYMNTFMVRPGHAWLKYFSSPDPTSAKQYVSTNIKQ